MEAAELMEKIKEYGADEKGIRGRFGENIELYSRCLLMFLDEPNFEMLETSIEAEKYEQAFEAAHALKGLSGNLGLTALYGTICVLVEYLRAEKYDNVEVQYFAVKRQIVSLRNYML